MWRKDFCTWTKIILFFKNVLYRGLSDLHQISQTCSPSTSLLLLLAFSFFTNGRSSFSNDWYFSLSESYISHNGANFPPEVIGSVKTKPPSASTKKSQCVAGFRNVVVLCIVYKRLCGRPLIFSYQLDGVSVIFGFLL